MTIQIQTARLSPWTRLAEFQAAMQKQGQYGATSVFVGTLRDCNQGDEVQGMELEHYPGMTETFLQRIEEEARARWSLIEVLIEHRVGKIAPGDPIVLIATWSAHRAEAFESCRYIIENLKSRAPFWKKETLPQGARWVAQNTPATE